MKVTFTTFKEVLANEIRAQDVSHFDDGNQSDGFDDGSNKQQDEEDEFEFIKVAKGVHIINDVAIINSKNELQSLQSISLVLNNYEGTKKSIIAPRSTTAASESENEIKIMSSSLVVKKDVGDKKVPTKTVTPSLVANQSLVLEKDNVDNEEKFPNPIIIPGIDLKTLDGVEAFELSSTSEKLKTIFLNQLAEKKVYFELSNRMAGIEKHIKKYGGRAYSKAIDELPLQVDSVPMFSKLEEKLVDASKTALAEYFNKTIWTVFRKSELTNNSQ